MHNSIDTLKVTSYTGKMGEFYGIQVYSNKAGKKKGKS